MNSGKGGLIVVCVFCVVLIMSMSVVSANWFTDFWSSAWEHTFGKLFGGGDVQMEPIPCSSDANCVDYYLVCNPTSGECVQCVDDDDCVGDCNEAQHVCIATCTPESADINIDGVVDIRDYLLLVERYGYTNCDNSNWCNCADIDQNGNVNAFDYANVQSNRVDKNAYKCSDGEDNDADQGIDFFNPINPSGVDNDCTDYRDNSESDEGGCPSPCQDYEICYDSQCLSKEQLEMAISITTAPPVCEYQQIDFQYTISAGEELINYLNDNLVVDMVFLGKITDLDGSEHYFLKKGGDPFLDKDHHNAVLTKDDAFPGAGTYEIDAIGLGKIHEVGGSDAWEDIIEACTPLATCTINNDCDTTNGFSCQGGYCMDNGQENYEHSGELIHCLGQTSPELTALYLVETFADFNSNVFEEDLVVDSVLTNKNCIPSTCGNDIVPPLCEDAGENGANCCEECGCPAVFGTCQINGDGVGISYCRVDVNCGDGWLNSATEECDDGCLTGVPNVCEDVDNRDGCSSTCQNEDVCVPYCAGKNCGNDGCGGTCGTCLIGQGHCVEGTCQLTACTQDPECEMGDKQCVESILYQECILVNNCLVWSEYKRCPGSQQICTGNGICESISCTQDPECEMGEKKCISHGGDSYQGCAFDVNQCLVFGDIQYCEENLHCSTQLATGVDACVECTNDDHCTDPSKPKCAVAQGFCIAEVQIPNYYCPPISEGGNFISPGVRVDETGDGDLEYCDPLSLTYLGVKAEGDTTCKNDYECESNSCLDGVCVSVPTRLNEDANVLKKIWCCVSHFGSCISNPTSSDGAYQKCLLNTGPDTFGCAVDADCEDGKVCDESGECVVPLVCGSGYADCNSVYSDGCEVRLGTNDNCGDCGDVCENGLICDRERYVCAPPASCVKGSGDINYDGVVNVFDANLLGLNNGQDNCESPYWCSCTDINKDGSVQDDDLMILSSQWAQNPIVIPQCVNGIDDERESDNLIDYPYDLECDSWIDNDESL